MNKDYQGYIPWALTFDRDETEVSSELDSRSMRCIGSLARSGWAKKLSDMVNTGSRPYLWAKN